jgi:hypothetical protein
VVRNRNIDIESFYNKRNEVKSNNKINMGKKLTWFESYTTVCKYSTSLTDEQAEQFEQDPDAFLADFDYQADQDLEWDKIKNEEIEDFEIEED